MVGSVRVAGTVGLMPCYHPVSLHRDRKTIMVGCGQCIGCRLERSREWAVRCMHEASLYEANVFVTLTYAPEHLPAGGTLDRYAFPRFVRSLRKRLGLVDPRDPEGKRRLPRYFGCGEYGDENARPHYHAILFGVDFPDKAFAFTSGSGEKVYTSRTLDEVWGVGLASVGSVTFESAAYVARYCVKKVTGAGAARHYESVDGETGEIFARVPERSWMSLKPGIGQGWLQMYFDDVYPSDQVVSRGHVGPVPRYYDKLASVGRAELVEELKLRRVKRAAERAVGAIPTLHAEEVTKLAQVGFLKREL